MKTFILAASAAVLFAAPTFADGLDNAMGNTVHVVAGENAWDTHFLADGTFTDTLGRSGTWTFDTQLCMNIVTAEGAQDVCGPWNESAAAGDTWNTAGWSAEGTEITVSIVAGH
ncbi:MAG: hypothetical protein P8J78_06700 [Maricaulis sp.]|jgi:hypothetical protein|nr:hypothetical protein [Maricaulis sp.]MDG2044282.1 hypothetical protein [Maricaulis sp.]